MTPALRTAILDALMERWRQQTIQDWPNTLVSAKREYFSRCLNAILPVAEPMIREAALREAAKVAKQFEDEGYHECKVADAILALGEPK